MGTSTLRQLYDSKETGTTRKNTYLIPLSELYIEDGYNVRDFIDLEHVQEFKEAFIAGEYVPALAVEVNECGVKIIDGHHRYLGAKAATEEGHEILRLECKDFIGTEADKIAFMITSSQGKPLTALERGAAYMRLDKQGWTTQQIAQKVKRSESDIIQHIQLMECSPYVQKLVRESRLNYALAIELQRKHGVRADSVVSRMMEKAEGKGKTKITRAVAQPQFPAKKARRFTEMFVDAELTGEGEFICLRIPASRHEEIENLLEELRNGSDDNDKDEQNTAQDMPESNNNAEAIKDGQA